MTAKIEAKQKKSYVNKQKIFIRSWCLLQIFYSMNLSIAVHFLEEIEERDEIPRRRLRDRYNVLEMTTNQ